MILNNDSLLIDAARVGCLSDIRELLEKGANIEARDCEGYTSLHRAAEGGYLEIVKFLIEKEANIDAKGKKDFTPLHLAARKGHLDVVEKLIENRANVNEKNDNENTPLHLAAGYGHLDIVEKLIEKGANINAKDKEEFTPLHWAAVNGRLSIVEKLIENRANVNEKNDNENTPLHLAAGYGHLDIVEKLIEKGANINAKDKEEFTPLHWAAGYSHLDVVEKLIEKGADISAKDEEGRTPLDMAEKSKKTNDSKTEVVNFLRDKQSEYDRSLLDAVKNRDISEVRSLLSRGANIEAKGDRSVTPLYCAARDNCLDIAKFLLDKGADANARAGINVTARSWTPLHTAAAHGNLDIVKLILDERNDVDARGALKVANKFSEKNSLEIRRLLEERIGRNEETTQHLIRRKRHQYSQEEGSSLSIGVHNRHSINSLQNDEVGHNKIGVTSGTSKPSSWIGSIVNWIKGSMESPALLTSREHDNITVIAVPEINATLVNNTIILSILATGLFNKTQHKQPIHENLLSPREQSMRLNNIDEDMIIRAMQESEEIRDPNTCMDEVEVSGNKTGMCKGGR